MADNTALTLAHARHLLRRATFTPTRAAAAALLAKAPTRGAAADMLLDFKPTRFRPGGRYIEDIHNKWVKYMIKSRNQLQEKLVLFWHDHFATAYEKVGRVKLMAEQNRLLRINCRGDFRAFVKAINTDAAMMEFLDTVRNRATRPNENYARELMELFTLGVTDLLGGETYTQEDIVQIARAFSGWRYDAKGRPEFRASRHDFMAAYPERGPKRIFKTLGGFGDPNGQDFAANGEGPQEIDTVIDIIFQHRYGPAQRLTVADYIARRLITFFAHPEPSYAFVTEVVDESGFGGSWDLTALLRAIFVHDDFYLTAEPLAAGTKRSVKWPVEYVVSTVRLLGMKLRGKYQETRGGDYESVHTHLSNMGQVLFEPPSVFGWDWELAWVSSSTLLARYAFARDIASSRDGGGTSFRPERLIDLTLTDSAAIVDAAAAVLGIEDQLGPAERMALMNYLTDNSPAAPVNLLDDETRFRKLHGLFGLLLQSPAFQLQ